MQIINPTTEAIIKEFPEDSREQIETKYQKALTAQPAWAAIPLRERLDCIQRFFNSLETEKDTLAQTLTQR
jgi:acyl-CoA reductase-like NAD-dependent aldehyde dehydrogenase